MFVYTVWYQNDLGTALWGVYGTIEKAEAAVKMIVEDHYGENAWYNVEAVQ